jgi:transcription elongation factor Elf1
MKTVEARLATWFRCPKCEKQTFIREVAVNREDDPTVELAEPLVCKSCGYSLAGNETTNIENGGALYTAWCFTCDACGKDSFTDVVIREDFPHSESCAERPPSRGTCGFCGVEFELRGCDPFSWSEDDE